MIDKNMKNIVFVCLMLITATAFGVPARKGQWRTIVTADGCEVRVELVGDEFCHYWRTADGVPYVLENGEYVVTDVSEIEAVAAEERAQACERRMERLKRNFGVGASAATRTLGYVPYLEGVKKGLVLLVAFADKEFIREHTPEFYRQVLNEGGYEERGYSGSVKQYFADQSNGKFTIDFDVYGVVTLPQPYAYYGEDSNSVGSDRRFYEMARTAVLTASQDYDIDWELYDWDNDGYVDQVYLLYAGYGQATKNDDTDLIWPKEGQIGTAVNVGAKRVKTVACSNEINWNAGNGDKDMGFGTLCHEFAHCLGYVDTYDVDYACDNTSMDFWDLMDRGSYNGGGFVPAPFTAMEKMMAGWITPTELEYNTEYNNMRPVTDADGGDVFVVHNPNNYNEYFLFENIQKAGWCLGFYSAKGMLISRVDYSETAWKNNLVNCFKTPNITNHSRYTYIPADGSYELTKTSHVRGDLYPYNGVDSFSGTWCDGSLCEMTLSNIRHNGDGTMSFTTGVPTAIALPNAENEQEGCVMYNLNGQRVNRTTYRGIVVCGGKKMIVR